MDIRHLPSFRSQRPVDRFVTAAVSDDNAEIEMLEFASSEFNTIDAAQGIKWSKHAAVVGKRVVEAKPLTEILFESGINEAIDVLLVDVEGHEFQVLKGANLTTLRPKIIMCELHSLDLRCPEKNSCHNLLVTSGYRLINYATMNAYYVRQDLVS